MDILPHERQIQEYVKTIEHLKKQNNDNPIFNTEIKKLEQKLEKLKEKIYSELTPWQRVQICRHPSRPQSSDYIKNICQNFYELCGDRTYGDDPSIIGGLAKIGPMKCMVMGQEKGCDTESRVRRNFGMLNPEGFRKALRLMQLAEKFNLPIVTFLDTPGAYAGLEAEERGQGWAIALNIRTMARINTPIIVTIIGEGCSGGALGMGVGDVVGMMEHAYYSVISPEACASILWKDAKKNTEAASILKLNAEDMLPLNIIDAIINEPLGGAHHDPQKAYMNMQQFILEQWQTLRHIPKDILLEQRYLKFRKMGQFTSHANS
ncbi:MULTISPECIES: acetyl-CoA carboxylase carboxyltransferase subunit alpha [unclassified Neochlamydia]|uniref:acetyl-CoA carboxylase carboxyltransferase subunit alpha n=1 Tax=unclassified Neochlamydia TaxID=2643326 RepID=UPI00140AEE93|nr:MULTISPECIES: acetyl-CoA carboxylase carboxyltransferase subunit alpha [unclassified Neochlamydia]MBS4166684.1 Acetyl-coenzyme A carboxylase carboxyl transferase subunit alpha [Neochlamydia sp. AcF65]MBS4171530.1 Acetyl-coenzyme A carboxylase carboxyl transferase subunit alpha [Neochlamydia sp. AcF95]NGY95045.1 Acetyl-coenzyme A carboxylase carboxyl transferase subunit alpha [Neochlamydia sp. AcF84]